MNATRTIPILLAASLGLVVLSTSAWAGAPIQYSGPMAKKHAGKFIFSKKPIPLDAKTEDGFTTSFSLMDTIYMRFWGKDTPENLNTKCRKKYRIVYRVSINGGKRLSLGYDRVDKLASALPPTSNPKIPLTYKTTFGDKTQQNLRFIRAWNGAVVPRLKVGDNSVKLWGTVDCGSAKKNDPTIAATKVTIKVKKGEQAKYTAKYGPLLPKSALKGGEKLMGKVVTMMTNKWNNEHIIGGRFTTDWWVTHHEVNGRALYRSAEVCVITRLKKETNPNACRLFVIAVKQLSKDGDKKFGKNVVWGGVGRNWPISCSAVKRIKGT